MNRSRFLFTQVFENQKQDRIIGGAISTSLEFQGKLVTFFKVVWDQSTPI
jgi:hypothetical protein